MPGSWKMAQKAGCKAFVGTLDLISRTMVPCVLLRSIPRHQAMSNPWIQPHVAPPKKSNLLQYLNEYLRTKLQALFFVSFPVHLTKKLVTLRMPSDRRNWFVRFIKLGEKFTFLIWIWTGILYSPDARISWDYL